MARVVLHHGIAVGLHVVLHRSGDVKQGVTRPDLGQALHQRLLGHAGEPASLLGGLLAHTNGDAAVAVVPVEIGPGVDLHQVAGLDHPLATGNAMHHLVVDRGADAGRKAVVALETGGGAHLADALFGMGIQVAGGEAGGCQFDDFPEHRGHDPAGLAHGLDLTGALDLHASSAFLDPRASLHQGPGSAVLTHPPAAGLAAARAGGAGKQVGKEVHRTACGQLATGGKLSMVAAPLCPHPNPDRWQ